MVNFVINFTKKQFLCVHKEGEIPVVAVLRYLSHHFNWDLNNDRIELMTYDRAYVYDVKFHEEEEPSDDEEEREDKDPFNDTKELYQDLGKIISWNIMSDLWSEYDLHKK